MGGYCTMVTEVLKFGPDVEARKNDGATPLHLAAEYGHLELARILLENGADVNATKWPDRTPLYKAAEGGLKDMVRLLIRHGADAKTRVQDKVQELLCAASKSWSRETIQFFIDLGGDVNKWHHNTTPLHKASYHGDDKTVQLLIQHGSDVIARNRFHVTPLHCALYRVSAEVMSLLIRHRVD